VPSWQPHLNRSDGVHKEAAMSEIQRHSSTLPQAKEATETLLTELLQTTPMSIDNDHVTELAKLLYEHIEGQIARVDTKAQLVLAADTILVVILTSIDKSIVTGILNNTAPLINKLTSILIISMFIALIISIYYTLLVIKPEFRSRQKRPSRLYFGSIAQLGEEEFVEKFLNQSSHDVVTSVLGQVYAKSQVAERKFIVIRNSLNFLFVALILWAVVQFILTSI
jgi:Pycsar effector protein